MKRPIVIALIGYILGIIMGLYLKISIVFLYLLILLIYIIYNLLKRKKVAFKLISIRRYSRYLKLYLNRLTIIIIIIMSFISYMVIINSEKQYQNINEKLEKLQNIETNAIIISNKEERKYNNRYKIKLLFENKYIYMYLNTSKEINLDYGDKIKLEGEFIKSEIQRNYGGFDYYKYLKQLKIFGTIKSNQIYLIQKNKTNLILTISNNAINKIKNNINKILNEKEIGIFNGLVLGDTSQIEETIKENFSIAGISHILAVSGMHVMYLIYAVNIIFKKFIGRKNTDIITIFIIVFYIFITNFSLSIIRAGFMAILLILSKLLNRKNDFLTTISISLFIILIYNPYLIENLSVQLSYGATFGIVFLNKYFLKILSNIKFKNTISISLSVQTLILPIILFHLNTFNTYFLISNILLSLVISPIIILFFIISFLILININIPNIIIVIVKFCIKLLIEISNVSKLPYSKIYITTPNLIQIIIYYIIVIILLQIYKVYKDKKITVTQKRFRNLLALFKFRFRQKKKKYIIILLIFSLSVLIYPNIIIHDLKIHFIDVGQGDSTFIITPQNKTILIDGGGNLFSDFDVGRQTLIPYVLDRGFTKIDVIVISHFDDDHVGRIIDIYRRIKSKYYNYW